MIDQSTIFMLATRHFQPPSVTLPAFKSLSFSDARPIQNQVIVFSYPPNTAPSHCRVAITIGQSTIVDGPCRLHPPVYLLLHLPIAPIHLSCRPPTIPLHNSRPRLVCVTRWKLEEAEGKGGPPFAGV